MRQPHAGALVGPAPSPVPRPSDPAPIQAPPLRHRPRPPWPRPVRLAPPGGRFRREPGAAGGARSPARGRGVGGGGGGGLGAGEVWAAAGRAALGSRAEAGGPGGARTGLRTPPGARCHRLASSPGKKCLSF